MLGNPPIHIEALGMVWLVNSLFSWPVWSNLLPSAGLNAGTRIPKVEPLPICEQDVAPRGLAVLVSKLQAFLLGVLG